MGRADGHGSGYRETATIPGVRVVSLFAGLAASAVICGCTRDPPSGGAPSGGAAAPASKDAAGTITIEADGGAALRVDVDECWSGQMLSFHGVELFHNPDTARRVRLVEDPVTGPHVVLVGIVPSRARVNVEPSQCTPFEERVDNSNDTLNGVRSVHGTLKMTCAVPEVGRVTANIDFTDCSFDNRVRGM
jgi:hypothetical protein